MWFNFLSEVGFQRGHGIEAPKSAAEFSQQSSSLSFELAVHFSLPHPLAWSWSLSW